MKSREELIELAENFDGLMTWVFQNDDDLTMEMVMADFALEQIALALTARDAEIEAMIQAVVDSRLQRSN